MRNDTASRFAPTTIVLHWLVALTIITLMAVGYYMEENEVYSLYPIHKSIGTLILFVALARVVWRWRNGWPVPVSQYQRWETALAKIAHWVLILGTLLFPISGMMMSGMGGYGVPIFGIDLLAPNIVDGKTVPLNKSLAGLGSQVHGALLPIMLTALGLHVAGALKHHIIDKDGTLRRMLGMSSQ